MQLPRQIPPYLTPVSSSLDLPSPPISQFVNNDDANFHTSVTSPIPFNEQHSSSKRSIKEAYSFKDDVSCEEESHAPSESEAEDELPDEDQTRIFSDEGAKISCIVHRPGSILIMAVFADPTSRWSPSRSKRSLDSGQLVVVPGKRTTDGIWMFSSRPGKRCRNHIAETAARFVSHSPSEPEFVESHMVWKLGSFWFAQICQLV